MRQISRTLLIVVLLSTVASFGASPVESPNSPQPSDEPSPEDRISLPPGGLFLDAPGFTVKTPGAPWYYEKGADDTSMRDGRIRTGSDLRLSAQDPNLKPISSELPTTSILVMPFQWFNQPRSRSPIDDALAKSKGAVKLVINGAECLRRDQTENDTSHGSSLVFHEWRQVCFHPEFPGFGVRFVYLNVHEAMKTPFIPDDEGLAVLNSVHFTPLGYRIHDIPLKGVPLDLVEADDAIWATFQPRNDQRDDLPWGGIARIDPQTNNVTNIIKVGREPWKIVAAPSGLWVISAVDSTVVQIDPKTSAVVKTISVPYANSVAAGDGYIWVLSIEARVPPEGDRHKLVRIDPSTGQIQNVPSAPDKSIGVYFADHTLLVDTWKEGGAVRIDPQTGRVLGTLGANVNAVTERHWIWSWLGSPRLARYTLDSDHPVVFSKVPEYPRSVADCGSKICIANDGAIAELDPNDLNAEPVRRIIGEYSPNDAKLLSARGSLWLTAFNFYAVFRLDPK